MSKLWGLPIAIVILWTTLVPVYATESESESEDVTNNLME
jgi:cytochrome c-type biogenesis protein CcmH/NrfF